MPQSDEHVEQVSPPLHAPSPQLGVTTVPVQSLEHDDALSPCSQVPLPHVGPVLLGQSLRHEPGSPASQVPLPHTTEAQRIASRIGTRLRRRREHLGWSQEALGERVSITPPAYGRIERGASLPSFPTFLRLCKELGLRPDELLAGDDDLPSSAGLRGWLHAQVDKLDDEQIRIIEPMIRYLANASDTDDKG